MSGTLTPDILKALRMSRDGSAPPPAAERLMVPSWAVQAMNDLVPGSAWRLTAAGAAVVALADELDEARLALAAEQGKQEGAPDLLSWSPDRIRAAVNAERIRRGISWRELARDLDIAPSGLTRWTQGKMLSAVVYLKVCGWLRTAMIAADKVAP